MTGKALLSMKDLEKRYASDVEDAAARINKPAGNTIGTRNSKFSYKGEMIGRELLAIIVDFVHAQSWYDEPFDSDNPIPPACHALSVNGDEMSPFKACKAVQSTFCDGCDQDVWGSADQGRGKACAQQYKLALLAAGPGETLATCDMATLIAAPTSLKNFDKYVKDLKKKFNRPPYGVLTRISFAEDEEWPVLVFEDEELIKNAQDANDVFDRREEARELLMTPPDFSQQSEPKRKKKTKKKVAKKKAAKKKPAKKKATKKKTAKKKRGASKFS